MDEEFDKELESKKSSLDSCIKMYKNAYQHLSFLYLKKHKTCLKTEPFKIVYGFEINKNTN